MRGCTLRFAHALVLLPCERASTAVLLSKYQLLVACLQHPSQSAWFLLVFAWLLAVFAAAALHCDDSHTRTFALLCYRCWQHSTSLEQPHAACMSCSRCGRICIASAAAIGVGLLPYSFSAHSYLSLVCPVPYGGTGTLYVQHICIICVRCALCAGL
jgi:hypothetical protein